MAKNQTTTTAQPRIITPEQRAQALATVVQLVSAGKLRLTRAQVEQVAKTAAPLVRAGKLSQEEQVALGALLASQSQVRF